MELTEPEADLGLSILRLSAYLTLPAADSKLELAPLGKLEFVAIV